MLRDDARRRRRRCNVGLVFGINDPPAWSPGGTRWVLTPHPAWFPPWFRAGSTVWITSCDSSSSHVL